MEKKTVLFDPGYTPLVMDSIGQIGYTYYMFSALQNPRIKKINYPNVYKKLTSLLKTNAAFYLGCMLWASYIKTIKNAELEGNKLLGEEASEEEYTNEINFLIDFVEKQLPRDSKYYLNKPYTPDSRYLPILKAYKDFLILNKGFVNCSNTNQIVMPKYLKTPSDTEQLYKTIQEALKEKNIESLLDEGFKFLF